MNLLLAAALLLQDKTAEETFRKFEEQIEKAKTVSFKYRSEMKVNREGEERKQGEISGALLLKGEGQARLETRMTREGRGPEETLLVSDGKKAKSVEGKRITNHDIPSDFRARMNYLVTRGGIFMSLTMFRKAPRGPKGERPVVFDLKGLTNISDFKLADGDAGTKALSYTIKPTFEDVVMEVTLHFQSETYKLVKRVTQLKSKDEQAAVTETYEDFSLGADIPDEKFKLPEK